MMNSHQEKKVVTEQIKLYGKHFTLKLKIKHCFYKAKEHERNMAVGVEIVSKQGEMAYQNLRKKWKKKKINPSLK